MVGLETKSLQITHVTSRPQILSYSKLRFKRGWYTTRKMMFGYISFSYKGHCIIPRRHQLKMWSSPLIRRAKPDPAVLALDSDRVYEAGRRFLWQLRISVTRRKAKKEERSAWDASWVRGSVTLMKRENLPGSNHCSDSHDKDHKGSRRVSSPSSCPRPCPVRARLSLPVFLRQNSSTTSFLYTNCSYKGALLLRSSRRS